MKVLWLTNIPSPYRVDFFNELGKSCDLTVLFEKQRSIERDDSWLNYNVKNFKAIFLKGKSVGVAEAFCPSVTKYLKKKYCYDHIVVDNFADLTGVLAIIALRFRRIPYEIESDGGFPGNEKGFKAKIKKWLFKKATRCFSTGKVHDLYYKQYRVKDEKIVRYPFTSLWEEDIIEYPLTIEEKKAIRRQLAVVENKMVLAVGQFIHRKGFDVLLNAIRFLPQDIGVYIVGGIPTEEYLTLQEKYNLQNVHFLPFKEKKELKNWWLAADCFVLPTREDIWGLVINEAMAYGLPVLTTERCVAGLELVENDVNGYIIPVDDAVKTAQGIQNCLNNSGVFANQSLIKIRQYTFEKMAEAHLKEWR